MSNSPRPAEAERNEAILARVDELGGGAVWDAEVFAVTFMDVAVKDSDAMPLAGLVGVWQIALACSRVSISMLQKLAAIPRLQLLVPCKPSFSVSDLRVLQTIGPELQVFDNDAQQVAPAEGFAAR